MPDESKLDKHIRLIRKHIKAIEKMGYEVSVGHMELNVYDYSDEPSEEEKKVNKGTTRSPRFWSPEDQLIRTIT